MSKKSKLKKQHEKQVEKKRQAELEEQLEKEEARDRESRSARKLRRGAKRGYANILMVFLTLIMLASFGYSGFYYGGITIVGDATGAAERMPSHTALLFSLADILMLVGILLCFMRRYILQSVFSVGGSSLYLIAGQRIIKFISDTIANNAVDPALYDMDKQYMKYYYPIAAVTLTGLIMLVIALVSRVKKARAQKRERDTAPVKSIVEE